MRYQVDFGQLDSTRRPRPPNQKFRLAVLADLSGRANAGRLETGAELARRKPFKVDVDTLDDVLAKQSISLALPIAEADGAVTVSIDAMDDFHPDELAGKLEIFQRLLVLRRNLGQRAGFERAAKEVLSWGGELPPPPPPRHARGVAIAADRRLSDFARLTGRPTDLDRQEADVDDLLRRLVGPFIQPAREARQDRLIAQVDAALSAAMRRVLHHPDFQAAEATWRGIDMLVRRIETGAKTEIVLYDVSAEELAADLAASRRLEHSGLYGLLVEQPALDAHQGALSAVIGLYTFELAPPHADLLGRVAQIAAAAGAPFVAGIAPDSLRTPMHEQHPMIQEAFAALHALPQADHLGLATPRFLLRMPYGRKTDPIDAFPFEEFSRQGGLGAMLWGHPALLVGVSLGQSWERLGAKMQPGAVAAIGDMPYYIYTGADGEQIALPCTERLYTERDAVAVSRYRVMPLLSIRGRPEVRLGGCHSVAGTPLAGFWSPSRGTAQPAPDALAPMPVETPEATPALPDGDATEVAPAEATTDEAVDDELAKLLADLGADPPPAAPDAVEEDLDALLASLK